MARSVNFDYNEHHMEAALESPMDEDVVHSSFSRLIEEQSHSLAEDDGAMEMEDLADEGRWARPGGGVVLTWQTRGEVGGGGFDLADAGVVLRPEADLAVGYLYHLTRLVQPEWAWRGQQGALEPEGSRQTDPLIEERWSSDTLRVLSLMPSRTIGRSRGAIISQYYNRTMQLRRRRQTRPSIRDFSRSARPSIRGYGVEAVETRVSIESKRDQLVNNLQNLSLGDRVRMLRAMPLSVAEKSELRKRAYNLKERSTSSGGRIPCCSRLKYYIIIALRQSWYSCLSCLHSLQLWQVALKRVSGRFGTGVLSYFLFLKTLLLFNVFLLLLNGVFLVIPQAVHPPPRPPDPARFTGLELLTGAGVFTNSVMYYGYYTDQVLSCNLTHDATGPANQSDCRGEGAGHQLSYNMPLAYFFTIGLAFFITCIILVYSMSKSFGKSFRINKSQGYLAVKVFSSWDFNLIKKTSVKLQSENICTQLKELLSEVSRREERKSVLQRLARLAVHALAWAMCLGITLACALAVYYFSEYMHRDHETRARSTLKRPQEQEASLLALPVVVSSINLLLPGFFNTVAWMEEYDSPSVRTYVAIFRNLLLKVSVLAVLCFHWLGRIAANPAILGLECWESFVGQELYRFLLMDFIFTMLDTFFGEFLWKLFSQKVLKRKRKPVFDIARNVLELIYGQTLAWLGVLFSPVLPAVQIIKLLLLFYMKKASVMMNCQAPRKPWRASQMSTVFITLLCFPSFLGAAVSVTYTMWTISPSGKCGPFRGLPTMFQSGKQWVRDLQKDNPNLAWLSWVHSYVLENPVFLFIPAGVFLMVIYFHTQVVDGQRKIISLLQEQIENEGEDKKFLITKLQAIHELRRPISRRGKHRTSEDSTC
ncbi:hypothetical protein MATL_G00000320 [Megalops atlanticus]|uniref:Transmembrane channel-like protein n=1 Tax=Megalops atlanticus TaxID=7932 RepID=A0A9D3QFI6_MEGAT|nr:hypothetical protein MATL_G00000320 [Megalops atlanticus]